MVCYYTHAYVCIMIFFVFNSRNGTNSVAESFYCIYVENRVYALHYRSHTFKTHARIYVRLCKTRIASVLLSVKLREYKIPEFHISVAVAAYSACRLAAAVFLTAVIVYFRAWTTGTYSVFPEVIFFSETHYSIHRDADFFMPYLFCLIIVFVNRNIKSVLRYFKYFRYIFPCPWNYFFFKIVSERKVSEHFKKCAMTCCFSYVFNIACTDTFLTCSNTSSRRYFLSGKIRLERSHSRIYKKKALVVVRNKRSTRQPEMIFTFKESEKTFSDFVYTHWFHKLIPPFYLNLTIYNFIGSHGLKKPRSCILLQGRGIKSSRYHPGYITNGYHLCPLTQGLRNGILKFPPNGRLPKRLLQQTADKGLAAVNDLLSGNAYNCLLFLLSPFTISTN